MPSAEFDPAIPATKKQQTHALDRKAIGIRFFMWNKNILIRREMYLKMQLTSYVTVSLFLAYF
jgi:hypothetical protein